MTASPGLVSVIIVNYNGANVIRDCLLSVFAQPYQPIEVIVVDNASTDESVAMIKQEFPGVKLVVNGTNLGFAGGNNRGVSAARGEYIVLLNNDATVERNWLIALIEILKQKDVGAVTSRVVTDGVPAAFYEMNGTINYLGYNIMRVFKDLSQVFFAGGASLMFKKETVGMPFPDEFFLYQEDVFLSWKLRVQGMAVAMAQQSVVHHRGSVTTRQQTSAFVTFYQERNRLLNVLLFYEARTLVLLIPYFIADAVAKVLLSMVGRHKSLGGVVRSYWWIVTHPEWIKRERQNIQSHRLVPDTSIMSLMSYKVIDSDSSVVKLINAISKLYAQLVGLAFHD